MTDPTLRKLSVQRNPLGRLLSHLAPQRRLVSAAVACSLLNKLFDLAPPALIGLAVDVVVRGKQSLLADFGVAPPAQQLWVLALSLIHI